MTHIHPDHYGLAGRVREASGAWVSLHPADARLIHERYDDPTALLGEMGVMLRRQGTPADEIVALQSASMPVRGFVDACVPDVLLEDGAKPDVPAWDLTAIWTPGHSPGHLCFWEDTHRLLMSGDHVLPRITPNVSFHPGPARTRLATSLSRCASWSRTSPMRCCRRTSSGSRTCRDASTSCTPIMRSASRRSLWRYGAGTRRPTRWHARCGGRGRGIGSKGSCGERR